MGQSWNSTSNNSLYGSTAKMSDSICTASVFGWIFLKKKKKNMAVLYH